MDGGMNAHADTLLNMEAAGLQRAAADAAEANPSGVIPQTISVDLGEVQEASDLFFKLIKEKRWDESAQQSVVAAVGWFCGAGGGQLRGGNHTGTPPVHQTRPALCPGAHIR